MYFSWIGLTAILLLGSTQSSVIASFNDVDSEVKVSAETTGVESAEIWALQMIDTMMKTHWKASEREIKDIEINDQCNKNKSPDTLINIQGDSCPTVPCNVVPVIRNESSGLCSSASNSSSNNETQVIHNVNDTMQNDPLIGELDRESNSSSLPPVESVEFTLLEIFAIIFYSTFGVFVMTCTICDFMQRRSSSWDSVSVINTLAKFSIYSNSAKSLSRTKFQPKC